MKQTFLTLLFTLSSLSVFCQDIVGKNQFNLNIGIANPAGKFSEMDARISGAGFADPGVFLSAGYTRFVSKHLGIGLSINHSQNKMDDEIFLREIRKINGSIISATSTPWQSTMVLTNLFFRIPIEETRLHSYLKLSGGFAHNTLPEITYQYEYSGEGKRQSATTTNPALGLGAGLQYHFSKLALGLEANYIYTQPEFSMITTSFKYPMNTLNSCISLSYFLGKN